MVSCTTIYSAWACIVHVQSQWFQCPIIEMLHKSSMLNCESFIRSSMLGGFASDCTGNIEFQNIREVFFAIVL